VAAVCPVKGAIAEVHRRIRNVLRDVTLAQVFRPAPGEQHGLALGLLPLEAQLLTR
jgi:hypothetical protein